MPDPTPSDPMKPGYTTSEGKAAALMALVPVVATLTGKLSGWQIIAALGIAAAVVIAYLIMRSKLKIGALLGLAFLLLWGSVASADVVVPKRIEDDFTLGTAALMSLAILSAAFLVFAALVGVGFLISRRMARERGLIGILVGSLAVGGIALADGTTHPAVSLPNAMAAAHGGSGNMAPHPPPPVVAVIAPPVTTPPPVALDPTIPLVPPDPAEKLVKLQTGLLALDAALHSTAAILGVPAISPAVPGKFWDTPTGHAVAVVFAVASLVVPLSIAGIGAYQVLK